MKPEKIDYSRAAEKLALRQRIYYIIVVIIFLLVSLFTYLYVEKDKTIQEKKIEIVKKDSIVTKLSDSLKLTEKDLKEQIVECTGILVRDKKENGEPMYEFTFKIINNNILQKLEQVDYYFNHPTYNPKTKTSFDSNNSFAYSYFATGCLSKVEIYLHYKKSDKIDTIGYRMCSNVKVELNPQFSIYKAEIGRYYLICDYFKIKSNSKIGYLQAINRGYDDAKILKYKSEFYLSIYDDEELDRVIRKKNQVSEYKNCWIGIGEKGGVKRVNSNF